jgi:hypothetical protein
MCGYEATLDRSRPFTAPTSTRIARVAGPRHAECAVPLAQLVDATPYRGRRVTLRAAIRVERAGEHAHLYLQRDAVRTSVQTTNAAWTRYAVEVDVPADARTLELGFVFHGDGRAWLDDVSLE